MADRFEEELAKAEQKVREQTAKGLRKAEEALSRVSRQVESRGEPEPGRDRQARKQARRARERERSRERAERRRRRRGRGDPEAAVPPARPAPPVPPNEPARARRRGAHELTPEERAYRDARRRANAKIGFMTHLIAYGSVLAFLLVTTHSLRVTLIVAAAWGIGIATHYFSAVVAPGLRRRLIEDEVGRSVAQGVTLARRAAETRHERSMEDLSASIAHEIRNPVAAAKSLVQQMGEDPVSSQNIEYASVALEELDRVERSISHLLRYARDEEIQFDSFAMADVVHSTIESHRDRIDLLRVELELQLDGPCRMRGDPEKMRRVLVNLVGNALDALEQGDSPVPRLKIMAGENLAGTEVWVRITDNGPGIHPDVLDKVFSPFFTTKDQGTGLGLALSKKIVDAHGGAMEVESQVETGTEFILSFPKEPESAS